MASVADEPQLAAADLESLLARNARQGAVLAARAQWRVEQRASLTAADLFRRLSECRRQQALRHREESNGGNGSDSSSSSSSSDGESDSDSDSSGGDLSEVPPAPPPPPGMSMLSLSSVPRLSLSGSAGQEAASDLRSVPKLSLLQLSAEVTPPDECESSAEKLRRFAGICSQIEDRLFLGSDVVARSLSTLLAHGITHVVNAAGTACPEYHARDGRLTYLTLHLYDSPGEDLSPVLYEALDFIEGALNGGGAVFVHCQQGVSRSSTVVVAHTMRTRRWPFTEAHRHVKERRGVAEPNAGFLCHLLQFWARMARCEAFGPPRLYRIVPYYHAPAARPVVPLPADGASLLGELDPRTAFILHVSVDGGAVDGADGDAAGDGDDALDGIDDDVQSQPRGRERCFVWVGRDAPAVFADAAWRWARLLSKYEHAPPARHEAQGRESAQFLEAVGASSTTAVASQARYDRDYGSGCAQTLTPPTPLLPPLEEASHGAGEARATLPPQQRWLKALNALSFVRHVSTY